VPDKYKFNKINIGQLAKKRKKKELLKIINEIDDPYYIEALIVQLEAKREQLLPEFQSYMPNRIRGH